LSRRCLRTILRNLRLKPKSTFMFTLVKQFIQTVYFRTTVEQLVKEVFELLMEFKPVSDESEEPVEREWLGKLRRQATKSAMCVAVAYQNR